MKSYIVRCMNKYNIKTDKYDLQGSCHGYTSRVDSLYVARLRLWGRRDRIYTSVGHAATWVIYS